jgi:hypothetical protein
MAARKSGNHKGIFFSRHANDGSHSAVTASANKTYVIETAKLFILIPFFRAAKIRGRINS